MRYPPPNLNVEAAETTLADIVKDCGLRNVMVDQSTQSIHSCASVHYVSTNSSEAIDHGAPKEVYVTLSGCFVDARITGIFTTKGNTSSIGKDIVSNISYSDYPSVSWTVTYTPSEEDLQKGVYFGYITDGGCVTDICSKVTSYSTFTGYNPSTAFAVLMLADCYNYVKTGSATFTTDPTSSFSSTSVSKSYGDAAFSAGFTTNSDGTISYSSSNTSVATVASNGTITIKGVGSTTITASTVATSAYNADSKTMALTVTKGNLTVKTSPTPTTINYGQKLSISVLSGGSAVNSSGSNVGGAWSWKSPETFPSAGTISYTVVFVPTDTMNYNY